MYAIKKNTLYLVSINNQWTNDVRRALQFHTYVGALGIAAYYPDSKVVEVKSVATEEREKR